MSVEEQQRDFRSAYRRRTSIMDVTFLLAECKIDEDDFDLWCDDESFVLSLHRIDMGRAVRAREKIYRNVDDIVDSMVSTALVGGNSQSVAAAKTLLENIAVFKTRGEKALEPGDLAADDGGKDPEQMTEKEITNEDARIKEIIGRKRTTGTELVASRGIRKAPKATPEGTDAPRLP